MLTPPNIHGKNKSYVRNETLIVEATLIASCIPRILRAFRLGSDHIIERVVSFRAAEQPYRNPSAPIWQLY